MATELPPPETPLDAPIPTPLPPPVHPPPPSPPPLPPSSSTLAPKRHRRPSVRLGEIGDQPATLRASKPPSWKLHPHPLPSSKPSSKTRPLTNLVSSDNDVTTTSHDYDPNDAPDDPPAPLYFAETNGNLTFDSSLLRASKKKRPRTTPWRDDHEFDLDPSPLREESADNAVRVDEWHAHSKRSARVRVSDSHDPPDTAPAGFPDEEVRNWLAELGLGKYAPVFEIHEVDEQVLPFLTLEDLKDMGISAVGSRRKIYCAVQKLRKGFS